MATFDLPFQCNTLPPPIDPIDWPITLHYEDVLKILRENSEARLAPLSLSAFSSKGSFCRLAANADADGDSASHYSDIFSQVSSTTAHKLCI